MAESWLLAGNSLPTMYHLPTSTHGVPIKCSTSCLTLGNCFVITKLQYH